MRSPADGSECPEKKLLICCARTRLRPEVAETIGEILSRPIDWNLLILEAARNSITPLVALHLGEMFPGLLPMEAAERLRSAARMRAARSLLLTGELIRIDGAFCARNIQGIPYKGPVIAAQAYGNVALREFDDIDIILRQRDMTAAHQTMLALGYEAQFPEQVAPGAGRAPIPGEYKYFHRSRAAIAELHTEFTLRHFPSPPDLDDFARRLMPVSLGGSQMRTFAPEDALTVLGVHGAKDFWERLSWIADIAELIEAHPQFDWDQALGRARTLGTDRMVNLGLLLAAQLLDAALPEVVVTGLQRDKTATELAAEITYRTLRVEGFAVASAWERFKFRRQMMTGAFAGWKYASRLTLAPAEEDWREVQLPQALSPLYHALRPFRLMKKYGQRNRP